MFIRPIVLFSFYIESLTTLVLHTMKLNQLMILAFAKSMGIMAQFMPETIKVRTEATTGESSDSKVTWFTFPI